MLFIMKYFRIMLFLMIVFPIKVFAIDFYCDNNVVSGGTFNCVISNNSNGLFELFANLNYSEQLNIKSVNYSSGYISKGNNESIYVVGPGFNASSVVVVINMVAPIVDSNQSFKISLSNIKFKYLESDTNYKSSNDSNLIVNVKAKNVVSSTTTTTSVPTTTTTNSVSSTTTNSNVFTVSFDSMSSDVIDKMECESVNGKCFFDLNQVKTPIKEGYVFSGWSENSTCDRVLSSPYTVNRDITLYACYEKNVSSNVVNYLASINIENFVLSDFNKFKFDYTLEVDSDVNYLYINPTALNPTAKTIVSDNVANLVFGNNVVTIDVIDNDTVTTYTINVFRKRDNDINDNMNSLLDDIMFDGKYIDGFVSDKFEYDLYLNYGTKSVNIIPEYDKNIYEVSIKGNHELNDNSKIYLYLTFNGEILNTYVLNIHYISFLQTFKYYVYTGVMFIFCLIVYFVVRYIKANNEKNVHKIVLKTAVLKNKDKKKKNVKKHTKKDVKNNN